MSETTESTPNNRDDAAQAIVGLVTGLLGDPARRRRFVAKVQIFVGTFLLLFGYWIGRDHCRLIFDGVKTQGKVVAYQEKEFVMNNRGSTYYDSAYMPVIEFKAGGSTVRFTDWAGTNFRTPMGGLVPIVYDADRPMNAMIDRNVMNWVPWAPMIAVGLLLLISGVRVRPWNAG